MTAAAIKRERVVVGDAPATLPRTLPPLVDELAPLHGRHRLDFRRFADPVNTRTVRELLGDKPPRWGGQHRALTERPSWLATVATIVVYAVLVPLALATLAVLSGCTPEDWPVTDGPATTVPVPVPGGAQ